MNKKIKFSRFDAADYLKTKADQDSYLEAAFADGDPKVIARALGDVARAKTMTKVAKEAKISRVHLYRALSSDGDPRLSTLSQVISALGYKLSLTPKPRARVAAQ